MWRWSWHSVRRKINGWVFSTYVEVIPHNFRRWTHKCCVLHVCGGDPHLGIRDADSLKCSPRMWRWSLPLQQCSKQMLVFSTYVEVILREMLKRFLKLCVLHVCGGDPFSVATCIAFEWCSPRMWKQIFNMSSEQLIYRILSCRFFNFCLTIKSFESKIINK